jgi:hypothetical protein
MVLRCRVYVYSLKEGINDGFLTPFRVKQYSTTLDEYVYTSDDQIVEGEIEVGEHWTFIWMKNAASSQGSRGGPSLLTPSVAVSVATACVAALVGGHQVELPVAVEVRGHHVLRVGADGVVRRSGEAKKLAVFQRLDAGTADRLALVFLKLKPRGAQTMG